MMQTTVVRPGYVYLFRKQGVVKIGMSANPKQRIRQFGRVMMIAVIATENMRALESYLHNAYLDCRVRGEWFRMPESDVTKFARISRADSPDDLPDFVHARLAGQGPVCTYRYFKIHPAIHARVRAAVAKLSRESGRKITEAEYVSDLLNAELARILEIPPLKRRRPPWTR